MSFVQFFKLGFVIKLAWLFLAVSAPTSASVQCGCHIDAEGLADMGLPPSNVQLAGQYGSKPFVTILVRFADSTGVTPHPKSFYEGMLQDTYPGLNHYWQENSYNHIDINGSIVVGWYNLPQPKSYYLDNTNVCKLDMDKLKADVTAVADADVNFTQFYGINVMLNDNTGGPNCGWSCQQINLDGEDRCWGFTVQPLIGHNQQTVAHEMGHAFGLFHSSGPYTQEYDSKWDVMSGGTNCTPANSSFGCVAVHTIAYHKDILGWLQPEHVYIANPGSDDTIFIDRIAMPTSAYNYRMVKVYRDGLANKFYTIEARRFAGYDASGGGIPMQGVVIHKVDTTVGHRGAQVVDVDNDGDPNDEGAVLIPGETFTDPANGLTVQVLNQVGTGYTVRIAVSSSVTPQWKVTNTNDSGPGSLRNAINYVNHVSGSAVEFDIPVPPLHTGPMTIQLLSPLPAITQDYVSIQGWTQTENQSDSNPDGPEIELDGSAIGPAGSGLDIRAAGVYIDHLIINNFPHHGVSIYGENATSNVVDNCYIGTDAAGLSDSGNGWDGIWIGGGGSYNYVSNCLVSGNGSTGVTMVDSNTVENSIYNCSIGTDRDAMAAIPNGWSGVWVGYGSSSNYIGYPCNSEVETRNIISGNDQHGVVISQSESSYNKIVNNYIGVDYTGENALPNGAHGVWITDGASMNEVGTGNYCEGNVISGNLSAGLAIINDSAQNTVFGNIIGLDYSGYYDVGNGWSGVWLGFGASNNQIGGNEPQLRNYISGNDTAGVSITETGTSFNNIAGNYIGTDMDGLGFAGNGWSGVQIYSGATSNIIGGPSADDGNVIAASGTVGVAVLDPGTENNQVRNNLIGTTATGDGDLQIGWSGIWVGTGASENQIISNTICSAAFAGISISDPATTANVFHDNNIGIGLGGAALGNGSFGVQIYSGASGNLIGGGGGSSQPNRIHHNASHGVAIFDDSIDNNLRDNSFYANGGLAINLVKNDTAFGVTLNDPLDADTGPNRLQNFPVLTSALRMGSATSISGQLASTPNQTFFVDIYWSPTADPSTYGEGRFLWDSKLVTTNVAGTGAFSFSIPGIIYDAFSVSATATTMSGSTSEFGNTISVGAAKRTVILRGKDARLSPADSAVGSFNFTVYGRVSEANGSGFTLDDGSGSPVRVIISGHTLLNGQYAKATGTLDTTSDPPELTPLSLAAVVRLD